MILPTYNQIQRIYNGHNENIFSTNYKIPKRKMTEKQEAARKSGKRSQKENGISETKKGSE
jgi:hypothetical protein